MKLSKLAKLKVASSRILDFVCDQRNLSTIREGYGRTHNFRYINYDHDPRPYVLVLGHYTNPNTGNDLLGGINLSYLTDKQIEKLRQTLPKILKLRGLKRRYWAGRQLLPDIFDDYYRTYNKDYVVQVTPGTLRFWSPEADDKRLQKALRKARKDADERKAEQDKLEKRREKEQEKDEKKLKKVAAKKRAREAEPRTPGEPPPEATLPDFPHVDETEPPKHERDLIDIEDDLSELDNDLEPDLEEPSLEEPDLDEEL